MTPVTGISHNILNGTKISGRTFQGVLPDCGHFAQS